MEYGLGLELLPENIILAMQKAQNTILRQIFSTSIVTSVAALHALTNIVPISYRNLELNARYFRRLITSTDMRIPIVNLYHQIDNPEDSIKRKNNGNQLYEKIKELSPVNATKKLKEERVNAVKSLVKRNGNVGSVITVTKDGKPNPLLEARFISRENSATLIFWRLGRIAYHQECKKCNGELSRAHAIQCSNVNNTLRNHFNGVIMNDIRRNTLDSCFESLKFKKEEMNKINAIIQAINEIKIQCLNWRYNQEGVLKPEYDVP
jgi:hypothetical protein